MTRLKFMVFALVVLGLGAYQLSVVSPALLARANENAASTLSSVPAAIAQKFEAQRSLTQAAALRVATSPAVWLPAPKAGAKPEAPSADALTAVRALASEPLPETLKPVLLVAVLNEAGAVWALGAAAPAPPPDTNNLTDLATSAWLGAVTSVGGVDYLVFSIPLAAADKSEIKSGGTAFIGLPLYPDEKLTIGAFVKETGIDAVGVLASGALKMAAGNKTLLEKTLKLKNQDLKPIAQGSVASLGPVMLPVFVDAPTTAWGVRREVSGPALEVVAVMSTSKSVETLAAYQRLGLLGLAGLLFLALVTAALLGGDGDEDAPRMVVPPPMPPPPAPLAPKMDAFKAIPASVSEPSSAPEASPDDFHFPQAAAPKAVDLATHIVPPPEPEVVAQPSPPVAPPPPAPAKPTAAPAVDPFAMAAPPPQSGSSAVVALPGAVTVSYNGPAAATALQSVGGGSGFGEDEEMRTTAYPVYRAPADPSATVSGDDDSDSTRVAVVPAELLKAARSGALPPTNVVPASKTPSGIRPVAAANDEDRHFQDVFKDFVATREKCGEAADGLTYDKFKAKLLKNKDQLVQKYNCKSVRFQVYVKEGKAALKATPVKE